MGNNLSPKEKRHVIYIALMGISVLVFIMFIAINFRMAQNTGRIVRDVVLLVICLAFINYWYIKSERFFIDAYDEYDMKDHIKKNGNKYKGTVVHIKENIIVKNNKQKIDSTVVIEFLKDGERKHILLEHFPYMIRVFDVSDKEVNKDKYLSLLQYSKDGVISFENMGEDLKETTFEGIIERNFEGAFNCDIFEYRGRYIIGEIPGYELEKDGYSVKDDLRGYKIFSVKVSIVFCVFIKIFMELF